MFKDNPKLLQDALDVADVGKILQKRTGGGGGMLSSLVQAGALIDIFTGLPTGQRPKRGSGLILLGPAVLGRILSTKGGAKWLSEGVNIPASKHLRNAPTQVIRLLRAAQKAQQGRITLPTVEQTRERKFKQQQSQRLGQKGLFGRKGFF